jgi:hypothetical protein
MMPRHKDSVSFRLSTDQTVESTQCNPALSMGWPHNADHQRLDQAEADDMVVKMRFEITPEPGYLFVWSDWPDRNLRP